MESKTPEKKKQPATTLKRQSNLTCNTLFGQIRSPKGFVEKDGTIVLPLAESSTKSASIFIQKDDAIEYSDTFGFSITAALNAEGVVNLHKIYDMVLDEAYQTHFQQGELFFKSSRLCELTNNGITNATRVKNRLMNAARVLKAVTFKIPHARGVRKAEEFSLIWRITDFRGGFSIHITPWVLELLEKMPKIEHDTVLYKTKDDNAFSYNIGRKIEEVAERQKKQKEVTVSMSTLMKACKLLPEYLSAPENYSRRIKWLEKTLNDLQNIGFINSWCWTSGRPTSINEESMTIKCIFTNERHYSSQKTEVKQISKPRVKPR